MAYVHKYAVAFDLIALKTRYWRQASEVWLVLL